MKLLFISLFVLTYSINGISQNFNELKKKYNFDIVKNDPNNGDGVVKVRNKTTKKWGMYQIYSLDEIIELIPTEYDSVDFFGFNAFYTKVYKKGKAGIYLCQWSYGDKAKQTIKCEYQDFKTILIDTDVEGGDYSFSVNYIAAKKNNKWGWINFMTGEEKSEFIYDTTEALPYPTFKNE